MDANFCGIELELRPGSVMTPRPATERLVALALERIGGRPARVADVGTGSGAVAVALALGAPAAEIWASDVSEAAVELARLNVLRHGVGGRVHVLRADLLPLQAGQLDLVVANLPYLPDRLRDDPVYRCYRSEPEASVFAPGDGLGHYRRLAEEAAGRLAPDGVLLIQLHREVLEYEPAGLEALGRLAA